MLTACAIGDYYCVVLLDQERQAKTLQKQNTSTPFWNQSFTFDDVPASVKAVNIQLYRFAALQSITPSMPPQHVQQVFTHAVGGPLGLRRQPLHRASKLMPRREQCASEALRGHRLTRISVFVARR